MKRAVLFILSALLLLSLCACAETKTQKQAENTVTTIPENTSADNRERVKRSVTSKSTLVFEGREIDFEIGCYGNETTTWKNDGSFSSRDAITDETTAVQVAAAIFNGKYKSYAEKGYLPQSVFYDEGYGVYIVDFYKDMPQKTDDGYYVITVGGDIALVIQKSDGKVVDEIWGE